MYSADEHLWIDLHVFGCGGDAILRFKSDCVELSVKPSVMPVSTGHLMFLFGVSQKMTFAKVIFWHFSGGVVAQQPVTARFLQK